MSNINPKKIALIDGYGFVFRAYHSLPPLSRNDGVPVGAVYGFTNMLIKLLASLHVSHIAVVFDSGSKTFRNEIFPQYKANRPPCPEDLIPQFSIVREAAESLNIAILEKVGVEADDIIATIAKDSAKKGDEVLIISSDKDLMQLVNDRVLMYDAMKNKTITAKEVKEKFLVDPDKVLDVLSLIGDSSDNVPGVRGIGPKTAAELIDQFGTLEKIFENLDQIKQEKRRQLLRDGIENAKLSKILISLKDDVELGIKIDDLEVKSIDPYKLILFLEKQGFRSLVSRVKKEFNVVDAEEKITKQETKSSNNLTKNISFDEIKKTKITSEEIFKNLHKSCQAYGIAIIDYIIISDELKFITISTCKNDEEISEVFYLELENFLQNEVKNNHVDLFSFEPQTSKTLENTGLNDVAKKYLIEILQDRSIKKIFFDSKNFLKIIPQVIEKFSHHPYEDLILIYHLLNSAIKNNFYELIKINLDENLEERGFSAIFESLEKNKNYSEIFSDENKKIEFFAFRNFALWQLYKIFYPKIFELKLNNAYFSFERPLLENIAQMELDGIKIDAKKLRKLSEEFAQKISALTKEIYEISGEEFNIASTQQLSKILFEKLGLSSSKKSKKTGALSTKSSVLEELAEEGHNIAEKILDFRKFSKLKNTYTDSLPKEINPKTGRIHSHFSTTSTITGRFNSSNPNLQNIPIKSLEGQKIREAFIAEKNHLLISADYSQIELRVIAHVAKIDNLITAFKQDKDIHKITASQVFGILEDQVDQEMRSKAKAINFGIIYGISAFGLARQLGISRQEASDYIKSYLAAYPGIDNYMKNYIEFARQNGYVKTISGRKCFIHEINNKNPIIRAEAERLAINAPIQGSAADIIKKAMLCLNKKLSENKLHSKIVLQVHDELIIEAPESEVEEVSKIIKNSMEKAVILDLPLKVDLSVGECWK